MYPFAAVIAGVLAWAGAEAKLLSLPADQAAAARFRLHTLALLEADLGQCRRTLRDEPANPSPQARAWQEYLQDRVAYLERAIPAVRRGHLPPPPPLPTPEQFARMRYSAREFLDQLRQARRLMGAGERLLSPDTLAQLNRHEAWLEAVVEAEDDPTPANRARAAALKPKPPPKREQLAECRKRLEVLEKSNRPELAPILDRLREEEARLEKEVEADEAAGKSGKKEE